MNDLSSLNTDIVKTIGKKLYFTNGKIRSTSKNRFASKLKYASTLNQSEKKEEN